MSDVYSDADYGDTDANNVPNGGASQSTAGGYGLPGSPADGNPNWRAGVFGPGRGLLGMARVSDLLARPGASDPQLMRVSDPVLDWERNSWRWNDPEAIAYDLDRKKRQLAEANILGLAGGAVAFGQRRLDKVKPSTGIGVGTSSAAKGAVSGLMAYMKFLEAPRVRNEIDVLQRRLNQLRPQT